MRSSGHLMCMIAAMALLPLALTADEDVAGCMVKVVTQPENANITVNGKAVGTSPATVRLAPGEYLIVANKDGHVESRSTLAVTERDTSLTAELSLDPILGLLLVHSDPDGADVTIDQANRGKTPLLVSDLAPGRYRATIAKRGFLSVDKIVTIADRTPQKIEVSLRSDSAAITVTSKPVGARVTVDGVIRGQTPCEVTGLPPGAAELILTLEGYRTYTKHLRLKSGDLLPVDVELATVPATLTLHSIPDKARVYVNNERKGLTPLILEDLEPGSFRVRVELEGYEPMARTVELALSDRKTEEFRLTRNSGLLEVITHPDGVAVIVDGEERGATEAGAGQPGAFSKPLVVDLLAPGTHTVQLLRKGYEQHTTEVQIESKDTARISMRLKRVFEADTVIRTSRGIYRGMIDQKFDNGDIRLELNPGVFRTFAKSEIIAVQPL